MRKQKDRRVVELIETEMNELSRSAGSVKSNTGSRSRFLVREGLLCQVANKLNELTFQVEVRSIFAFGSCASVATHVT